MKDAEFVIQLVNNKDGSRSEHLVLNLDTFKQHLEGLERLGEIADHWVLIIGKVGDESQLELLDPPLFTIRTFMRSHGIEIPEVENIDDNDYNQEQANG